MMIHEANETGWDGGGGKQRHLPLTVRSTRWALGCFGEWWHFWAMVVLGRMRMYSYHGYGYGYGYCSCCLLDEGKWRMD